MCLLRGALQCTPCVWRRRMGKTLDVGKDFAANLKLKRSFFPIFFQQNLKNAAGHNFFPGACSEGFSFRGVEVFARRCFSSATACNGLQPSQPTKTVCNRLQPFAMRALWPCLWRVLPNCNFWRFQTSRNIVSCGRRGTW